MIAWAAAALQCDESCTRDGHWWTDPAAYQWSVQFGLACVVLFATITALVSVAKRRKQVTAWSGVVALVLAVIWAKLVLLDASFLG